MIYTFKLLGGRRALAQTSGRPSWREKMDDAVQLLEATAMALLNNATHRTCHAL